MQKVFLISHFKQRNDRKKLLSGATNVYTNRHIKNCESTGNKTSASFHWGPSRSREGGLNFQTTPVQVQLALTARGLTVIVLGTPLPKSLMFWVFPSRDSQNTESVKYHRLGQAKSSIIGYPKHCDTSQFSSSTLKVMTSQVAQRLCWSMLARLRKPCMGI